jgi:hypothetical protein
MLPLVSDFILPLLLFVDSVEKFQTDSDIHSINTRNANVTSYHKVLTVQLPNYSVLFHVALNV